MLMEQINEIVNDSFYVKKGQDYLPCEFAFLHISEEPNETYVAYFKHRDIEKPIIYWWEKDDVSYCEDSRRFIIDFVGEAYLSLYIKNGLEKPVDKPLWRHFQCINCGIPSKWWNIIDDIKRPID